MTSADAPSTPSGPILVTGVRGQLGAHVLEAAARRGLEMVGVDRDEFDIASYDEAKAYFDDLRPRAVIHCAAYTNVDGAESDRETAFHVNGEGSRVLAQLSDETGAHLVAVSTDYVFPGTDPAGCAEYDATGPINVYGESKLAGELAIRDILGEGAAIARTAWLFSAQGPNFVQTIAKAAREREFLEVVDDQVGNPTWAGHLADALLTLADERIGGTHHLVGSPAATWFELAQAVVDELGLECEVRPTTSEAFVRPAKRAACSILRVTRDDTPAMGEWRDGVRASLRDTSAVG
ncbi:MAG: spsK [Thermoleophilia bacterium]|nr:spsK [Thermoleophilia bacterium]